MKSVNRTLKEWREGSSFSARQAAGLKGGEWSIPTGPIWHNGEDLLGSDFEESSGLIWACDGDVYYIAPGDSPIVVEIYRINGEPGWFVAREYRWDSFINS